MTHEPIPIHDLPGDEDFIRLPGLFRRWELNDVIELGADFHVDAFKHVAVWNAECEWIEMRLRSRTAQSVKIPALDLAVDFEAGEELHTEISAKFRREGVRSELAAAGLELSHWWTDDEGRFALSLSRV